MKRPGKCIGKKKYAFRTNAEKVVIRVYATQARWSRVYECPTCLDFHLTTRKPEKELEQYCRKARGIYLQAIITGANKEKLLERLGRKWVNRTTIIEQKPPKEKTKKKTTEILPLAEQKDALEKIDNKLSWWQRLFRKLL